MIFFKRFNGMGKAIIEDIKWMVLFTVGVWVIFSWWWLIQDVRYQWSLDRFKGPGMTAANGFAPTPGSRMKGVP